MSLTSSNLPVDLRVSLSVIEMLLRQKPRYTCAVFEADQPWSFTLNEYNSLVLDRASFEDGAHLLNESDPDRWISPDDCNFDTETIFEISKAVKNLSNLRWWNPDVEVRVVPEVEWLVSSGSYLLAVDGHVKLCVRKSESFSGLWDVNDHMFTDFESAVRYAIKANLIFKD